MPIRCPISGLGGNSAPGTMAPSRWWAVIIRMLVWSEIPEIHPPLSLSPKPRGAVILSGGAGRRQVLRACGAQDDRPARFAKGERETTLPVPDPSDVAEPVTFAAVARSRTGDVPPTLGPNERFEHEARDQQDEAAGEGGNP